MGCCFSLNQGDTEFVQMAHANTKRKTDQDSLINQPNLSAAAISQPISPPAPLLQAINFAVIDDDLDTGSDSIHDSDLDGLLDDEEEDNQKEE